MAKNAGPLQVRNIVVPAVVLLLLSGYLIFTIVIFRSILENQRAVHELQVSYYRLEAVRGDIPPEEETYFYADRLAQRRQEFERGISRVWGRPFFQEMKKYDPGLAALMQKLRLLSSRYSGSSMHNMPLPPGRATKRELEENLAGLYRYISEYGNRQMSTLWMANFFITAVFVLYTIVLFSLYLRNRYTEAIELRVRAMGRAYITRLEMTKNQIAYDIHDMVIQELGSARLKLRAYLEEAESRNPFLEDAHRSVETSIDTLRGIINGMQQWDVRVYSLAQALRHLIDEEAEKAPFALTLKTGGLHKLRLPEEHKVQILSVVHEALSNVKKHAEARDVVVSAVLVGNRLEIRVKDDGKGFDLGSPSYSEEGSHIGLVSMEERARIIGGSLTVRSRINRGTVIRLTIPLEQLASGGV